VNEILTQSLPLAIAIFVATAMLSLGLDLTVGQIVQPLRNRRLVTVSLIANVVVVPLVALGLASVIPMDRALRIGFLLYAFTAGSEAGPKLAQLARGNAAFAMGVLVLLIVMTVVFVPMAVSVVVPDAQVARGKLLLKLLAVVVLPAGIGLYIKARHGALATRLSAIMHRVSTTLLFVVFVQLVYVNFDEVVAVQASALLAGLLLFAIAFVAGYAMGGPERANRRALAIMTFIRAGSISMMIAGQVFVHDPKVLVMATVMTTLSVVLGIQAVVLFRRSPA
jgi:bile acid:Na+ symporter, BASS family